jgi:hypothetical protein
MKPNIDTDLKPYYAQRLIGMNSRWIDTRIQWDLPIWAENKECAAKYYISKAFVNGSPIGFLHSISLKEAQEIFGNCECDSFWDYFAYKTLSLTLIRVREYNL